MQEFINAWRDTAFAEFFSSGVAIVSLIVAICAWLSGSKANRRLVAIEEGRDAKASADAAKANLVAQIEETARYVYKLTITNIGSGAASNVKVALDDVDVYEHGLVMNAAERLDELDSGAVFRFDLRPPSLGGPQLPKSVAVEWQDGSGKPGRYNSHL